MYPIFVRFFIKKQHYMRILSAKFGFWKAPSFLKQFISSKITCFFHCLWKQIFICHFRLFRKNIFVFLCLISTTNTHSICCWIHFHFLQSGSHCKSVMSFPNNSWQQTFDLSQITNCKFEIKIFLSLWFHK